MKDGITAACAARCSARNACIPQAYSRVYLSVPFADDVELSIRLHAADFVRSVKQQFLNRGASGSFAQGYVDMHRSKDEGMDNAVLRTSENTSRISFRTFCEQGLQPTVASS